jgi:hypothetical protein
MKEYKEDYMNDCFWLLTDICEIKDCKDCKHYIGINSDKGTELTNEYVGKVNEALKPVREEFAIKHY